MYRICSFLVSEYVHALFLFYLLTSFYILCIFISILLHHMTHPLTGESLTCLSTSAPPSTHPRHPLAGDWTTMKSYRWTLWGPLRSSQTFGRCTSLFIFTLRAGVGRWSGWGMKGIWACHLGHLAVSFMSITLCMISHVGDVEKESSRILGRNGKRRSGIYCLAIFATHSGDGKKRWSLGKRTSDLSGMKLLTL